jgi:hypothetical protein
MHPIQDHSDLGELVRKISAPDLTNVVHLRSDCAVKPLTPEEALVHWMLDLPDDAAVCRAADYALRHIDGGADNSPQIDRLCDYLRQVVTAQPAPAGQRRGRRQRHV